MSFNFDQELDCSGLACPMPILKTKKAVDSLQLGQVLKMIATDPGSLPDIQAWTNSPSISNGPNKKSLLNSGLFLLHCNPPDFDVICLFCKRSKYDREN